MIRTRTAGPLTASILILVSTLGLGPEAKPTKLPNAVAAVRDADQQWLRAFVAKDLDRTVGFCDEAGAVLAPNEPRASGRAAIRELFANYFTLPDLKAAWQPTDVRVARSGELAYTTGTYQMSFTDPSGKTVSDQGKYVTVWEKQDDGTWKVLLDVFNTDVPMAAPSPKANP
jgi:ketosteroid isomerase-like protein